MGISMNGIIFDIKRFAVHDGEGIRTTVFFKGCPLSCKWCHNPEGLSRLPETAYYENKCISCGACAGLCNNHAINNDHHHFNRANCTACGKCAEVCPTGALKHYGTVISVEELVERLCEDREFYALSNGGVTLSGGECLLQANFCRELLKSLKALGINTAVDTCGYVQTEAIDKVAEYTDIFLYDIKAIDRNVHLHCTGKPNELILSNLLHIDKLGKKAEVRIPYVPGMNDGEIEAIGKFLKTLGCVTKTVILPYHDFSGSKYTSLGKNFGMPATPIPTENELDLAYKRLHGVV